MLIVSTTALTPVVGGCGGALDGPAHSPAEEGLRPAVGAGGLLLLVRISVWFTHGVLRAVKQLSLGLARFGTGERLLSKLQRCLPRGGKRS
jgi:hypothetical protein